MKGWVLLPAGCPNLRELGEEISPVSVHVEGPPVISCEAKFRGARWLEVELRPANVIEALAELASGQDS